MKKIAAIHFGAGNIGRGLIASVYKKNDIFSIFIDTDKKLTKTMQEEQKYTISYDDNTNEVIEDFLVFDSVKTINLDSLQDKYEIRLISTSIGTQNFNNIKNDLLFLIKKLSPKNTINIIAFENEFRASTKLKNILNDKESNYIDALVDRIVPISNKQNSINIFTEKYFEIILDKSQKQKCLFLDKDIIWVDKFNPFLYRKFWIINSTHLLLGYLFKEEADYLFEIIETSNSKYEEVQNLLDIWFKGIKIILKNEFNFSEKEIEDYINKNTKRIFNKKIKDEMKRIRRDPIKKLKKDERVFSLYFLFKKYSLVDNLKIITKLINKMLENFDIEDEQSMQIKLDVEKLGKTKALMSYSSLQEKEVEEILNFKNDIIN